MIIVIIVSVFKKVDKKVVVIVNDSDNIVLFCIEIISFVKIYRSKFFIK